MTLEGLRRDLVERGVILELAGDRVRFRAQPGKLTPELAAAIREHKAALAAGLRQGRVVGAEGGTAGEASPFLPDREPRTAGVGVDGTERDAGATGVVSAAGPCDWCGSALFWLGAEGRAHCRSCEPPAVPGLVVERLVVVRLENRWDWEVVT